MTIFEELLDALPKGVERPGDVLGDAGLTRELKIKLMERMPGAELTAHLGYEEGKEAPPGQGSRRNGTSAEMLKGQDGEMPVAVARDRDSSFEPEVVKKGQARTSGMDDRIIRCPEGDCEAIGREGALCRRTDGPGHRGPSARSPWPQGLARPDQPRHRRGSRRGSGPAGPGAGADVSVRGLRRSPARRHWVQPTGDAGEDPRRRQPDGEEQVRLGGVGRHLRRPA